MLSDLYYQVHRTMHSRVTPSTVAFTLQVPLATAVTVPLALTVATLVLVEDQVGVELVPDTFRVHLSPAKARVKSFRLRLRLLEAEPLLAAGVAVGAGVVVVVLPPLDLKLQRTIQLFSPTPATVAVMVTVPRLTAVTFPSQETEATLGLLDFQVMSPLALAGV